jgi:hypothetical protein
MPFSLWRLIFIVAAALVLLCMFGLLVPRASPRARRAALTAATGYAAMALINFTLTRFGLSIPVNPLSLVAAGVLGAPGAVLTAALYAIL